MHNLDQEQTTTNCTIEDIQEVYPGINPNFDYGLLCLIQEVITNMDGTIIYNDDEIYIEDKNKNLYSTTEILFEAQINYL